MRKGRNGGGGDNDNGVCSGQSGFFCGAGSAAGTRQVRDFNDLRDSF